MSLCEKCANACYRNATYWDPPEWWCRAGDDPYEEYDDDEDEIIEVCDSFEDYDSYYDYDEPDPDLAYEMYRDRMAEIAYDQTHGG